MDLDKLAAAKLWLVSESPPPVTASSPRDLPYLTQALYALIPVASGSVPRMTCDEHWRIYVNETWLSAASIPEIGTELAHMAWHLLSDHAGRARDQSVDRATSKQWKQACDATIHATLEPVRMCPADSQSAAQLGLPPDRSAEEYHALLTGLPVSLSDRADDVSGDDFRGTSDQQPEEEQGCGSGADGLMRPHELGPDADVGAVPFHDASDIRTRVAIDFVERSHLRGDVAGESLRWARRVLDPVVPWEPLLAGAVRRAVGFAAGRGEHTYQRPSRRASSLPGVVLPGQRRPVPRISVIVDTSGSVDDGLLARALAEADGALLSLGVAGVQMTVYSVDAAAHTAERVRSIRDATLIGAGGTDLRVGLVAVEAERPRPDVVLVFTDGETPWPQSPPPGSAVIIALLGRSRSELPPTPAWATRVECLLDPRLGS